MTPGTRIPAHARRRLALVVGAALAALALCAPAALGAGHLDGVGRDALPDFDARTGSIAPTAAQKTAVSRLKATVTWNRFGTPHTRSRRNGFLATAQGASAEAAARSFLAANAALFRLADA